MAMAWLCPYLEDDETIGKVAVRKKSLRHILNHIQCSNFYVRLSTQTCRANLRKATHPMSSSSFGKFSLLESLRYFLKSETKSR